MKPYILDRLFDDADQASSTTSEDVPTSTASLRSLPSFELTFSQQKISCEEDQPFEHRAFACNFLCPKQANDIVTAAGQLGCDPSSENFASRTKSIAFVLCLNGQWFQIKQNFFNQNVDYNDFSGGYKRFYVELPRTFVQCDATQKLLTQFQQTFDIEEGQLVLVQVQSSNITPGDEGKCLTGQGIHSDGADRAMLVCLERNNIEGARSSAFADVDGEQRIIDRHLLSVGSTMFWKDNEIYHYVEPARLADSHQNGNRTVLIAHYPAMHYITGEPNPNNLLPPSGKHPKYLTDEL